jgi:uncharacterized membrane protein
VTGAPAAYQISGVCDLVVYPYPRREEDQGATGINERGQIVGLRGRQGFVWEKGVRTDIGFLPDDQSDEPKSPANAVNERGQVVGGSGDFGPVVLSGLYRCAPYLWEQSKMRRLAPERLGASFEPFDINDRGMVVGRREFRGFTLKEKVFTLVPTLSTRSAGNGSSVRAVNNRGVFVGATTVDDPKAPPYELPVHAFVWVPGKNGGGRMKDLGTLPGYRHSAATDINERGDVIGVVGTKAWWRYAEVREPARAVLWRGGKATALGFLPGAASDRANAINDSGWIVGSSGGRAVLWQADRPQRAVALNDRIPPGSGWVLETATAINNRGWIAGRGTRDGKPWVFLLTPAAAAR